MAIAAWLEQHPAASKVHYPGLPTHPGHAIASRQQSGFGAMLSLELPGGVEEVRRFIANVRYFTLAESLGGVERLVAHPATITHPDKGEDVRTIAGFRERVRWEERRGGEEWGGTCRSR